MRNNTLNGTMPDFFYMTPRLYALDLSNNTLAGIVPASLVSLNPVYMYLHLI